MSTYLYAIVPAEHPTRLGDRRGVGDPAGQLRRVEVPGLAAVVSDAWPDIRPKRRDVAAHHAVLEALCEQGPALPIRFGMVAPDDDMVVRQLDAEREDYLRLLAELDGLVEFNVKATHHEEPALRAVLAERPDLRQRNDELSRRGDASQSERVDFGRWIAAALDDLRERHALDVLTRLRGVASREHLDLPVDGGFLNVSVLVHRDDRPKLEAVVAELARTNGELIELTLTGPLPAYSFVDSSVVPGRAPERSVG